MALIPWHHKRREGEELETLPLTSFRREMERLLDTFVREPFNALPWSEAGRDAWFPAVDVAESENEVTVRAELPGIDPKELDVHISGDQLVLSGEKKERSEKKGMGYYRSETRYGSFRRTLPLPVGVDSEHVDARYENGVLTLHLKKSPEASPKRIEVKVAS